MRIGIVAGEPSGDLLGGALITALKQYFPDAEFCGIAGKEMLAAGAKTLFPLETLSVMGFTEVLSRLPSLLKARRQVKKFMQNFKPAVYIGIDAPDFNLPIETALRRQGIKTVHYNSPTIWAWRAKRIFNIKRAVDLMLVLFPFEAPYYQAVNCPVRYIGHPLADQIPLVIDSQAAKQQLGLPTDKKIVALLPGSRQGEIKHIGPVMLEAAQQFWQQYPTTQFISPMVNTLRLAQFKQQQQAIAPELPLKFYVNDSHAVMAAADSILLASGTATLQAMLFKKPMVVMYRGSALSYAIAKHLVKIRYFALPNILANTALVPEFIQAAATAENIVTALIAVQTQDTVPFTALHQQLRCNASAQAALAIRDLIQ